MSPAALRELEVCNWANNFEEKFKRPPEPGDLWEAGFARGEINMINTILHLPLDVNIMKRREFLPKWFIGWLHHIKKNREKFL